MKFNFASKPKVRNLLLASTFVAAITLPNNASALSVNDFFNAASSGNMYEVQSMVSSIRSQISASPQYNGYQMNLDFTDANGNTPLMQAASRGHIDVVDFLVRNGANPNITNAYGDTAFTLAQKSGHQNVVNYFLTGYQTAPVTPQYAGRSATSAASTSSGLFSSTTALTIAGAAVIGGGVIAIGAGGGSSSDGGSGISEIDFGITPNDSGNEAASGAFVAANLDNPASDTPGDFLTTETATNEGIANLNANFAHARGYDGRLYNRDSTGALQNTTFDDYVIVGVFDSGVDLDHTDLDDNVLADEGITCRSGECVSGGDDTDGHGTAVAGVIAAERNSSGTSGIAPEAKIVPIDFLTVADLISAIDYSNKKGVDVFNYSFGFPNGLSETIPITDTTTGTNQAAGISQALLRSFVTSSSNGTTFLAETQEAVAAGRITVVAAGNDSADQVDFLAGLPFYFDGTVGTANAEGYDWSDHWVAAVSVDDSNVISTFSTQCGVAMDYCLAAPGEIDSTTAMGGGFASATGTSFAAPNVAGAIAIMLGAYPHLETDDVLDILFETATDLGAAGTDPVYGRGLVNLDDATTPTDGGWTVALSSVMGGKSASFTSTGLNLSSVFGDAVYKSGKSFIFLDAFNKDYTVSFDDMLGSSTLQKTADEIFTDFANPTFSHEAQLNKNSKMSFTLGEQEEGFSRKSLSEYADDDENKFALQYGIGEGKNSIKTFVNYNVNAGDVIGFSSTSKADSNNLLVSDAFKNPYLAMTDHAMGTGTEYNFGDFTTKVMLYDGETERQDFEFVDSNRIRGFVSEINFPASKELSVSLQNGMNIEEETFLGSEAGGALDLNNDTKTYYSGIAARYSPATDIYLNANYNIGITKLDESGNSLINGVSNIYTDSFALGAEVHNLYNNNDILGFAISQPLKVRSASAKIALPQDIGADGSVIYDRSRLSLAPQGQEIGIEAFYNINFQDSSKLSVGSMIRLEPDHVADAPNEEILMLKYKTNF